MNPYSVSLFCFGFCSFFVGLLILFKRPDSIGKVYFIFTVFNALWALSFGICWAYNDLTNKALLYLRVSDTIAIFIPPTWLHFVFKYTQQTNRNKILIGLYFFSCALSAFGFSGLFIPVLKMTSLRLVFAMPGVLFCVFAVYFTGVIFVGFLILIFRMNQTKGKERKQLFGFILATSLGFVGGGLTLPPVFGMEVPQYAIFLMPLYPFLTAFFMMKKGLFDLDDLAQAAHRDKLTAIGVLAASINHEVKNPLFVIKGLAESCLERQKEGIFSTEKKVIESANDAMQRSIEQADRAMDIIKRLSLFAKAGIEGEMKFESVSVSEVMENILPLVRYELAVHSITLTRDIPKDLPDVHADRRYLEEIFFNLIVNAIQALRGRPKPGEIKITAREGDSGLETRNSSCSNNRVSSYEERVPVIITIQDNGPGIPADKLKDVFRPFYTTKAEGTGLGLYITQQLVEKIGGRIAVESQAGMGTTFTVALKANNP